MTVLGAIAILLGAFPEYTFEPGLLAGNHLALEGSPIAVFHNAALLSSGTRFACSYAMPFSIAGLHYGTVALSEGGIALGASYFGERAYGELLLAVGKVHPMTEEFEMGLTLKGMVLAVEDADGDVRFTLDPSIRYVLNRSATLSVALRNAFSFFTESPDLLPSMDISLRVKEGEGLEGILDYAVEEGMRPSLRVSQSLELSRLLSVSLGGSIEPDLFHCGLSVRSIPSLQYAFRVHSYLGETHSLALTFGR
jgi:hypothetical protein